MRSSGYRKKGGATSTAKVTEKATWQPKAVRKGLREESMSPHKGYQRLRLDTNFRNTACW
jgi:hypothetical protein